MLEPAAAALATSATAVPHPPSETATDTRAKKVRSLTAIQCHYKLYILSSSETAVTAKTGTPAHRGSKIATTGKFISASAVSPDAASAAAAAAATTSQ